MTFIEWLRSQARSDLHRENPFASLYEIGPDLADIIGSDAPNVRAIKAGLDERLDDPARVAKYLSQLVEAMALWKLDTLSPDTAGEVDSTDVVARAKTPPDMLDKTLTGVMPPVMCGYRSITNAECGNLAVPGAVRCGRHGGAITDPEVRSSLLLLAYSKIVERTEVAVDALLDVAENSRTDMARVQAAKELLDRAGIVQDSHIHVHGEADTGEERVDLVDRLRRQLESTKDRLQLVAIPATATEVDGDG